MTDAAAVMARADALCAVSEEPGLLVRPYGGAALREAGALVGRWMEEAGMAVRRDAVGNVVGRLDGAGDGTLVLGSHLDTVRDAGRYDGPLGVLVALACVERLRGPLPFAIEVAAFADEEGLRFATAYLGSAVYAGDFDPALLELRDADGIRLADAVRAFGGDPDLLAGGGERPPPQLLCYCEVHIEQGPVLEQRGLPVGVVSAIAGQSRIAVELSGEAGHAGTVPMDARRDALCAAAEVVLAVERAAHEHPGLVATVGELAVRPGAGNVIPGHAALSLDVRHRDDAARASAVAALRQRVAAIAARRGVALEWAVHQDSAAVSTDADLTDRLARAIEERGLEALHLPSGAGHDAAALAAVAPVGMLFVRCRGGVSHHPAEAVEAADVAVAIDVLERFLMLLAEDPARRGF